MERTMISELNNYVGQNVKINGWVHKIRDQKKIQFIIVRDHTGLIQVVSDRSKNQEITEIISQLPIESAITVTGNVVENPKVKLGGIEMQLADIQIENTSLSPLPIDLFGGTRPELDKRLSWRYLDLRRPEINLIFKVQTTAEMAMREYWISEGFFEIHSPKLTGSASESGAELFTIIYFDREAYLAQSPQFYKQMAMSAGFGKVFEIGPVFRANPSFTTRHDTEFTSVDVEISWIESHEDIMSFEEKWLKHVIGAIKKKHGKEIKEKYGIEIKVPDIPFPRIKLEDAIDILESQGHTIPPDNKGDLDPQGERLISEYINKQYSHEFVFLTDYPVSARPFYHMRYENSPHITKSYDLLWKGLEITTGAQREHRYDVLVNQSLESGLSIDNIQYYLDFFKYGCPPHGGFGFGLTRMLMILLGLKNVREVTYIYRGPDKLYP